MSCSGMSGLTSGLPNTLCSQDMALALGDLKRTAVAAGSQGAAEAASGSQRSTRPRVAVEAAPAPAGAAAAGAAAPGSVPVAGGALVPAKGRGRGRGRGKNDVDEMVPLLAKMALNAAQKIREHHGVLFETYMGPASCEVSKVMEAKGKEYSSATKGQRGHGLGPPHIHVWAAMVQALAAHEEVAGELRGKLNRYHSEKLAAEGADEAHKRELRAELCNTVRQCRIERLRSDDSRVKVYMHVRGEVGDVAGRALVSLGYDRAEGQAPPGAMERVMQGLLEGKS